MRTSATLLRLFWNGVEQMGLFRQSLKNLSISVNALNQKVVALMATQEELAAELVGVKDAVVKIGLETSATLDKVAELEAALANVVPPGTSPAVDQALADLKAQVQLVDDLIPDAPATPA